MSFWVSIKLSPRFVEQAKLRQYHPSKACAPKSYTTRDIYMFSVSLRDINAGRWMLDAKSKKLSQMAALK